MQLNILTFFFTIENAITFMYLSLRATNGLSNSITTTTNSCTSFVCDLSFAFNLKSCMNSLKQFKFNELVFRNCVTMHYSFYFMCWNVVYYI